MQRTNRQTENVRRTYAAYTVAHNTTYGASIANTWVKLRAFINYSQAMCGGRYASRHGHQTPVTAVHRRAFARTLPRT